MSRVEENSFTAGGTFTAKHGRRAVSIVAAVVGCAVLTSALALAAASSERDQSRGQKGALAADEGVPQDSGAAGFAEAETGVVAAPAAPIGGGDDLWITPCGGSIVDFSSNPLPADMFGAGSDPFAGVAVLQGNPLTIAPGLVPFAPVDTIVRRGPTSVTFACPGSETIPIEIVALQLESCAPITVTFNGGQNPELWNIDVCLDQPQTGGQMTVNHECREGGSYNALLNVSTQITGTRISPPGSTLGPITRTDTFVSNGWWTHNDIGGLGLSWMPTGTQFDDDCDGVADIFTVNGAFPDFFPGQTLFGCNSCLTPATGVEKELTPEQAQLAAHGVLVANPNKNTALLTEACCLADGSCIDVIPSVCPGISQGFGTSCATTTCPAPQACPLLDPTDPNDPCETLQATDCVPAVAGALCRPSFVQVDTAGAFATKCDCFIEGPGCGPLNISPDGLTVSCPGTCQPPQAQGPCNIFYTDTGGVTVSTGLSSAPISQLPANTPLWCDCDPADTGACCFDDGTCSVTTQTDCTGLWAGAGTDCTNIVACCFDDAALGSTCEEIPDVCCTLRGGTASGTTCGPQGACCDAAGNCSDTAEACCAGTFYAGQTCSIESGACCFDADGIGGEESCAVMNRTCCEGMGGTFLGINTQCGGRGACCTDPDVDGVFEVCEDMDAVCCEAAGGVFHGLGTTCTAAEACCFQDGTCDDVDPLCCKASGGNPQGAGSICNADTCVPPDLTCPLPAPHSAADICASLQAAECQTNDPATLTECLPKCVEYDPLTGIATAIECACAGPDECHVELSAGAAGGLRTSHNPCVVVDDGTGTVHLPPDGCDYLSPDEVHEIIDGLPTGTTIELAAIHKEFICRQECGTPGTNDQCTEAGGTFGPNGEIECFHSKLELEINMVSQGRSLAGFPRTILLPDVKCLVHTGPRTPGDAVQGFDTEMVQMQGALPSGDPDFLTLEIVAGLDNGLPSPGHTTLTRVGGPGTNFAVDSFFDITYRIDFEGDPGGALAGLSGSTTGTVRMQTGSAPACVGGCADAALTCEQKITDVDGDGLNEICCVCEGVETEACCLDDGTCIEVPLGECACVYHGIPQGAGTDCTTTECPVDGILTGMNIDIHQDNPAVVPNDFHIEGIVESSKIPIVVDHIDDLFPTFTHTLWQGDPQCPVGSIWWCFSADWEGADYPFCTTLHLGLLFEVVCHNVMIDLTGWWTVDGVKVGGARDATAAPGEWPIIGFDVEDNFRVQPNPDPPDPRGQSIRLKNGTTESMIPIELIQMQLVSIGSSGMDGLLGPRPLAELREGGLQDGLPWIPVLDPSGALVSPTNPVPMLPGDEIMVLLRPASGRNAQAGEYFPQIPMDIPVGGYLIAKQQVRFQGNGPGRAEEIHWFWELHGAHKLPVPEACCLEDGTCVMMLPADCICAMGTPQGLGTVCTGDVACCFDDGTCRDLDPLCCENLGGTPQPAGSICLGDANLDNIDDACQPPELVCPLPVQPPDVDPCAALQTTHCPWDVLPTTTECKPRCAVYNALTGTTTVTECDCMDEDCYLKVEPGSGLRTSHNPCEVIDNGSGTVTLPPDGCDYLSPEEVHMIIDGLPAGTTIEFAPIHTDFMCSERADAFPGCPPPGVCEEDGGDLGAGGKVDCFDSVLKMEVQGFGPPLDGFSRTLYPQLLCQVYTAPRAEGDAVQDFDTEMYRCEGEIFGDPDFCTFRVRAGRHFGLPSPGHTTLTALGTPGPGTNWAVDSFFDVEYQIEFQGCPGSALEGMIGTTTGKVTMQTGNKPSCVNKCPDPQVCVEKVTDLGNGDEEICCICEDPVDLCPLGDDRCTDRPAAECTATGGMDESCLVHAWVIVDGPVERTAEVDECDCLEPGGCGPPELVANIIICPDFVCPSPPPNERCQVLVNGVASGGPSVDINNLNAGDRITCDCAPAGIIVSPGPAVGVHAVKKNRILSIDPSGNEGGGRSAAVAVAIELQLSSMLRCSGDLRRNCKVDADCPGVCTGDSDLQCSDDGICILTGNGLCVPTAPCVEHPDVGTVTKWVDTPYTTTCLPLNDCTTEHFAKLRSTALFRNWTEATLHVLDCEVIPAATYEFRSWDGSVFSAAPLTIGTVPKSNVHYADVVGPVSGGQFTPPDGITNVLEIQAFLIANQGGAGATLPPHTTWVDIHGAENAPNPTCPPGVACIVPQQVLNVGDLQTIKFGFAGDTYSETPGQNDPSTCP